MRLNHFIGCFVFCATVVFGLPQRASAAPAPRVLVVTTTTGFRHSSIATAEKILGNLAMGSGLFQIDYIHQPENEPKEPRKPKEGEDTKAYESQLAAYKKAKEAWDDQMRAALKPMGPDSLRKYKLVIFANTTGDLPIPDPSAFIEWIRNGGSFVGMHSASDTFHGFSPYIEMLGGEFQTHKEQVTVTCINQDPKHPACKHLSATWTLKDEIYILKNFHRERVHGLLGLDAHPNDKTPGDYPIAWTREVGQGRVFYTSLGHREDVWESKEYQQHILGGIKWALRLE
jgi:type 1 glutamine amidotransferase